MSQIIFKRVKTAKEKKEQLINLVTKNYYDLKRIQIFCPSEQVANYIDDLLWTTPEESFLPHSIQEKKSDEKIVITQQSTPLNRPEICINLSSKPIENVDDFEIIYELWDESDTTKMSLSSAKKEHYLLSKYVVK